MSCSQCLGIENLFDQKSAEKDLARYLKKGPDKTTRILVEAIQKQGIQGYTLLDIGGGVGAIQHALLDSGVANATAVEASKAFSTVALAEAKRRSLDGKISYHHGNFVDLAQQISPADIVTLDRVICCYHDFEQLVGLSSQRAVKIYGMVYPTDAWWMRIIGFLENVYFKLSRRSFRIFVHPNQEVEAVLQRNGFTRRFFRKAPDWLVAVYTR